MISVLFVIASSFVSVLNLKHIEHANVWEYIAYAYNTGSYSNGGIIGAVFGDLFVNLFGEIGAYIVFVSTATVLTIIITGKSLFSLIFRIKEALTDMSERAKEAYLERESRGESYENESYGDLYYDIEAAKEQPVFNHVINDGHSSTDERVELINDSIKRKNSDGFARIYDANINTPDDLLEVIEAGSSEGIFPFPAIAGTKPESVAKIATDKHGESGKAGDDVSIKLSGSGIKDDDEYYKYSSTAQEEPEIKITQKVQELDELLKTSEEYGTKSKKGKFAAVDESVIENEIQSIMSEAPSPDSYQFPNINLLKENNTTTSSASRTQIYENSKKLEQTLKSFGVEARVVEVSKGPTVTRYELSPGPGVKVSKISGLADDLALNLAAVGIRIEAPIPGKSVVGIEIPNKEIQPVFIREVIDDQAFRNYPSKLAFALGKDIAGNTVITDIAKMPHLLVAGSTGSGKSVCINTLITSILYKARPDEVKLLMIDPKVVELSVYNGIPHLLIPVVTDPKKAAGALNWAVVEMNNRYKYFAEAAVRDLKGYNNWKMEQGDTDLLPQIVIIIDELADLMMAAPGEVEESICRLAQMARAAGLHIIIATQRPSVDVITGLIKANIPSRLAFAVSSGTDSRTVLDAVGAEKLLGKGDMLFNPVGLSKPQRIQGAFISDKEVEAIVTYLKSQCEHEYDPQMVEEITSTAGGGNTSGECDELLVEAVDFMLEKDKASVSMLQRRFRVGYNRAARLMEEIEGRGIVGPEDGSKPRKILMSRSEWYEYKQNYLQQ